MPPFTPQEDDWIIPLGIDELRINRNCTNLGYPCFHYNNLELSSIEIATLIERRPELEHTQYQLWWHFQLKRKPLPGHEDF
jgi:hypothetical protein